MSFCDILKSMRDEKGVTQKEVALSCGFTPTCICQLENGTRNPTGSTIRELAKYFGCSADFLLELETDYGIKTYPPTAPALSDEERNLLDLFREMERGQRNEIVGFARGLLSESKRINRS